VYSCFCITAFPDPPIERPRSVVCATIITGSRRMAKGFETRRDPSLGSGKQNLRDCDANSTLCWQPDGRGNVFHTAADRGRCKWKTFAISKWIHPSVMLSLLVSSLLLFFPIPGGGSIIAQSTQMERVVLDWNPGTERK